MRDWTRIDTPGWIFNLGSKTLIQYSDYLKMPQPWYDKVKGEIIAYVKPLYGNKKFGLPIEKRIISRDHPDFKKIIGLAKPVHSS